MRGTNRSSMAGYARRGAARLTFSENLEAVFRGWRRKVQRSDTLSTRVCGAKKFFLQWLAAYGPSGTRFLFPGRRGTTLFDPSRPFARVLALLESASIW